MLFGRSVAVATFLALAMPAEAYGQATWTFTLTPSHSVVVSSELLVDDIYLVPVSEAFPLVDGTVYVGEVELSFADGHSQKVVTKMQVSDAMPAAVTADPRALAIWFQAGMIASSVTTITVRQAHPAADCERADLPRAYCDIAPAKKPETP